MWSSLEIAKLIASLLIPLVIVILGYYFNRRLKQIDQYNEDRHRRELEVREQEHDDFERPYAPHTAEKMFALKALQSNTTTTKNQGVRHV